LFVQVDVAYQYLSFFLEDDDELKRVRHVVAAAVAAVAAVAAAAAVAVVLPLLTTRFVQIGEEYKSGRMLSGELKKILIDTITVR
jgi:hypothetical protein